MEKIILFFQVGSLGQAFRNLWLGDAEFSFFWL
jgi:hypothetical protein